MSVVSLYPELSGRFGSMEDLENEPPVEWLIKGWLAAREISVLYGKGGTFKSYIALGWTLQLALARRNCLYVAAEGTSGLRSRVDAWMAGHHLAGRTLDTWSYYNANVHIDEPDVGFWLAALQEYLVTHANTKGKLDLVVVDTLARNFAGDESSPRDVGRFIEGCERIKRELGTAVLIIHHMGVTTGRERGSAALRNAVFAMFKTNKAQYNTNGGGSVELECDRMKDAPMPNGVRVYFDTVSLDVTEHGEVHRMSQSMRTFPPRGKQKPRREVIEG